MRGEYDGIMAAFDATWDKYFRSLNDVKNAKLKKYRNRKIQKIL